ncbi:MAG TPA: thioredoxin family protein [Rudaea sp.]
MGGITSAHHFFEDKPIGCDVRRRLVLAVIPLAMTCICSLAQSSRSASAIGIEGHTPVHAFDAKRDVAADIAAAVAEARQTDRRVIVYVGGDWCAYCGQMDDLFRRNPDLLSFREAGFVTVYVHYPFAGHNGEAFKKYGKVLGVPHYFVLDGDGALVHSQHLLDLRADGDYSAELMRRFLEAWRPGGRGVDASK